MDLSYGTTYYKLVYADPMLTMPSLTPMVYIGENIFKNEDEKTYYFQDTVSVLIFGLISEAKNTTDCHVYSYTHDELDVNIISLQGAVQVVSEAEQKAKSLGYPKLKKASGQWSQP